VAIRANPRIIFKLFDQIILYFYHPITAALDHVPAAATNIFILDKADIFYSMNEALIADRSGVEATTMSNRFAHHAEVQVPVQMAMAVDNGPTPLEVSGGVLPPTF
jgi:hypothetical protein